MYSSLTSAFTSCGNASTPALRNVWRDVPQNVARIICVTLIIVCSVQELFAQANLAVQDPRQTWRYGRGQIEEATIAVTPKGAQMEIGLFMTFSSKGTPYTQSSDSLEVQYFFSLPAEAVVTDSWLWVGNDIMQAGIYDTWTASAIYESIVRRRQDPSILRKHSATSYSLRIYPLKGNETRKVKINYLLPVKWTTTQASVPLPTDLLAASSTLTPFKVLFRTNAEWQRPRMEELKNVAFTTAREVGTNSEYQIVEIDPKLLGTNRALTLTVPAPMPSGVYVSSYKKGAEGFYQAVVVPSIALGIDTLIRKKIVAVIDNDGSAYSPYDVNLALSNLKSTLRASLTPRDSFNLVLSRLTPWRYSARWVSADSVSLERAFDAMNASLIAAYSNLGTALATSVDFIRTQGGDGSVFLMSNSEQFSTKSTADQFVRDISSITPKLPPMYICNFMPYYNYNRYFYLNGTYYYGNSYLYETLARNSGGQSGRVSSISEASRLMSSYIDAIDASLSAVDFSISLANGYCHSRFTNFDLNAPNLNVPLRQTIAQVGKFQGDFPLRLQIGGRYKDKTYIRSMELTASDIYAGDSIHKTMWTSYAIRAQEAMPATATNIRTVLDYSLPNRILSLYSAFLALEPNDTIRPCATCSQPDAPSTTTPSGGAVNLQPRATLSVANNTSSNGGMILAASPNPFRNETQISVDFAELNLSNAACTLEVYNVLGQKVTSFTLSGLNLKTKQTLVWDGKDASGNTIGAGTYFLTLTTPQKRITLRIVKVE